MAVPTAVVGPKRPCHTGFDDWQVLRRLAFVRGMPADAGTVRDTHPQRLIINPSTFMWEKLLTRNQLHSTMRRANSDLPSPGVAHASTETGNVAAGEKQVRGVVHRISTC